ncbi:MAG: hypothetical protein GY807_16985, partial [Gammaproteobacteria bacterium]|nr:hypothetical protein [Gammaproteobacteria bacterium]
MTLNSQGYQSDRVFRRNNVNNRLIPTFGEMRLSDLKRRHVRDWASQYDATA